jgi:type I restriction enzyme R subunit
MIEFKQIIGRGTRLYQDKYFFTVFDFVKAYEHFAQPEWDGEAVCPVCGNNPCTCKKKTYSRGKSSSDVMDDGNALKDDGEVRPHKEVIEIKLSDGKIRKIKYQCEVMFWSPEGKPVPAQDFIKDMYGKMPDFYKSIDDLKRQWADPDTREKLLTRLADAGYDIEVLNQIRHIIDADDSDLLDVLEYVSYAVSPIERRKRAEKTKSFVETLPPAQQSFIDYIIVAYIENGVKELGKTNLPGLIEQKFHDVQTGIKELGGISAAQQVYNRFQQELYMQS